MSAHAAARMVRGAAIGFALLAAIAGLGTPARAQDVQFPKGLRVGLVPPKGLPASPAFSGFGDPEKKVGLALAELPAGAYYAIQAELFHKGSEQGITVLSRELFPFAGGMAVLVVGRQDSEGVAYRKWLMVASEADFTAVVQAQVPEAELATYSDAVIRAALATVTFRPTPIEEQLAMLPFHLDDLAGFRVQRAMPQGVVVLADGDHDDQAADQPHVMVMIGHGGPELPDQHAAFAQHLLEGIPGLADMRLTGAEPMRIGGKPGYEVRAQARDPQTGVTLRLIQWLRFGGGGFLRVVGVSSDQGWAQAYPRFRAVRDGVATR